MIFTQVTMKRLTSWRGVSSFTSFEMKSEIFLSSHSFNLMKFLISFLRGKNVLSIWQVFL